LGDGVEEWESPLLVLLLPSCDDIRRFVVILVIVTEDICQAVTISVIPSSKANANTIVAGEHFDDDENCILAVCLYC